MNTEYYILLKVENEQKDVSLKVLQSCGVSPTEVLKKYELLGLKYGYHNLVLVKEVLVELETTVEMVKD